MAFITDITYTSHYKYIKKFPKLCTKFNIFLEMHRYCPQ